MQTTVIKPQRKWFDIDLKGLWRYRDLYYMYIRRDIVTQYKQTILGPLWYVIQPLFTTIMYMFVFGGLAGISTDGAPQPLFYMAGIVLWGYFSQCFTVSSDVFGTNANVFGKVYFPRLVTPIATAFSHLISFGIQFLMFAGFWIFFAIKGGTSLSLTPMLLFIPLIIIQMMLLSVGFGIIVSSVTTKYRDLQMLVGFGLSLWQYATPIAYGLTLISSSHSFGKYLFLYELNPMTPVITTFRYAVFGFGVFDLPYYLISWAFTIVIFILGLILFSKIERTFMDTI